MRGEELASRGNIIVVRYSGTVIQWYCGTVIQRYSGTVVPWFRGMRVQGTGV